MIGQALYAERLRLRKNRPNWFTRGRFKRDKRLWNEIQSGLVKSSTEVDRSILFNKVLEHYAEEIGGHFSPGVYDLATKLVPWGFNWLLNVASVKQFVPWKMTENVSHRIAIHGEVDMLKKLSSQGTILMVPTHQSNIDSILIGYIIELLGLPPFSYGAGLNLFTNPVLSFFMGNLGTYTVDRQKSNDIYKLVLKNYSTRILEEGIHSIFFPGGGRSRSGAVENRLKLGLLGTAIDAEVKNHMAGKPKPRVFVVPMVLSYNFVLEASSLIEDYLADAGKDRYLITYDDSYKYLKVLNFFWKFFSKETSVAVRLGAPMDVLGNPVDELGRSRTTGGREIDPRAWFTSLGELKPLASRDQEYTRELGQKIVKSFHINNTVLASHIVAFSFFELLRRSYADLDLYRLLRISLAQRSKPFETLIEEIKRVWVELQKLESYGQICLDPELKKLTLEKWVLRGIEQIGIFHEHAVICVEDQAVWTEDMNLLYYYRNRLTGYGIYGT